LSLVAIVARDLIIATRIAEAAAAAGHDVVRVDSPDNLPPAERVSVAFVSWDEREPDWGHELASWATSPGSNGPRLVVFGPHTDLVAHAEARSAGIGTVMARSKLVASLSELVRP
jgi:nucleoside-diphosphate-sugar epimerase